MALPPRGFSPRSRGIAASADCKWRSSRRVLGRKLLKVRIGTCSSRSARSSSEAIVELGGRYRRYGADILAPVATLIGGRASGWQSAQGLHEICTELPCAHGRALQIKGLGHSCDGLRFRQQQLDPKLFRPSAGRPSCSAPGCPDAQGAMLCHTFEVIVTGEN